MTPSAPDARPYTAPLRGGDVDLRYLAWALWHHKGIFLAMLALGALFGGVISLMTTKYRSEGLFLTPDVTAPEYKGYEAAFASEARLEQFLALSPGMAPSDAASLRALLARPGALASAVSPVFAFTDKDAKLFGVTLSPTEEAGNLVGLQLALEQKEPSEDSPVIALSEYLRDTMIHVAVEEAVLKQCLENRGRERQLRSDHLLGAFNVRQQELRAGRLRKLIADLPPQSIAADGRQVVTVENGSERFLSPGAQLVGVEMVLADLAMADARRERDAKVAALSSEYYCAAMDQLREPRTGRDLLAALETIAAEVFEAQDAREEVVEQTAITLQIERQDWLNKFVERMRFVVTPQHADMPVRRIGPVVGALLGGVLGGLFGVVLSLFLAWWRENRDAVTAARERR